MNKDRGSQNKSGSPREQPRIVRIEIVPAEDENREEYLLTRVGGKRRQRLLEELGHRERDTQTPHPARIDPRRAVAPLLRSLETAHQLVGFLRREKDAGAAEHEALRAEVIKCVLEATNLRDGLADYLAELQGRDDPTAA